MCFIQDIIKEVIKKWPNRFTEMSKDILKPFHK